MVFSRRGYSLPPKKKWGGLPSFGGDFFKKVKNFFSAGIIAAPRLKRGPPPLFNFGGPKPLKGKFPQLSFGGNPPNCPLAYCLGDGGPLLGDCFPKGRKFPREFFCPIFFLPKIFRQKSLVPRREIYIYSLIKNSDKWLIFIKLS